MLEDVRPRVTQGLPRHRDGPLDWTPTDRLESNTDRPPGGRLNNKNTDHTPRGHLKSNTDRASGGRLNNTRDWSGVCPCLHGTVTITPCRRPSRIMRLVRSVGRLRLLVGALGLLATLYIVVQLRTPDSVDDHRAAAVQSEARRDSDPSLLSRNFKASYQYEDSDLVYYKKDVPLIWVGGVPRSGTTLMRVMMDAHPDVRCGEETRVIPRLLSMHVGMTKSVKEMNRLREAKITETVLDHALGAYILSIIAEHGETAPRLCNKDPFTLKSMDKILDIFPNSKFLFMVRDGRATVHSIISRHVTIKGFDINSYRGGLQDWNRAIDSMNKECDKVGRDKCMPVFYEQLVLHPRAQMERILRFLDVRWDESVIHHERSINKTGGVSLSGKELSTDQVQRPINTEALTSWVPHIPPDVRKDMDKIAPMLRKFGYDPTGYPPHYGEPDPEVKEHDMDLKLDQSFYLDRKPKFPEERRPGPGVEQRGGLPLPQLPGLNIPRSASQRKPFPWEQEPQF